MKPNLRRSRPRLEADDALTQIDAMFPGAELDQFSVTGTFAGDLLEYNIPADKVVALLGEMQSGEKALYANNPPTFAGAKDGQTLIYVDGEDNDEIPLPNVLVIVLAENGADFDPLLDQQGWMDLGTALLQDELSAELYEPGWEAVAQFLGWRPATESSDADERERRGERMAIDICNKIAKTYGIKPGDSQSLFMGGGYADPKTLDKLVAAGYDDDATSYGENEAFFQKAGVTDDDYHHLVMHSSGDGEWADGTGHRPTHRESVADFDVSVDERTGTTAIWYNGDMNIVSLGVWNEEEPLQVNVMDTNFDLVDTKNFAAADWSAAVAFFNSQTGEKAPMEMLQRVKDALGAAGKTERRQNSFPKPKGAAASETVVSRLTAAMIESHRRNTVKKSNRTFRAIAEAKALPILRKDRTLRMVREDELDASQFYIVVAPEGSESSEVKIDDGQIFVGPFGSADAASAAVGADAVDVVDGNLEPAGGEAGDMDDLSADDISGLASPDLPMESRQAITAKIRGNVLKRIQREATALDVDTTIGSGTELSDGGSGNLQDKGAPPVAVQSPEDAGKSHPLDIDTTNPPTLDGMEGAPLLNDPMKGGMDKGADRDLSGAGAGKGSTTVEGTNYTQVRKGNLVKILENGRSVDRGNVVKVEGAMVYLEGDVSYDATKFAIHKIA